jgi:hypothetical protein
MSEDESQLPAPTRGNNRSVRLHDNGLNAGNLIDGAISRLDEDGVRALGQRAAEVAIDLKRRQAEQNMDYVSGKKAIEDHIDAWDALNKNGRTTRQSVTTDVNIGAGRMHIESKSGATCFVASAAYGDWHHPDVEFLRWYRDNFLANFIAGRAFIRFYWVVGPYLARAIAPHEKVRSAVRELLTRLVRSLRNRTERAAQETFWRPRDH